MKNKSIIIAAVLAIVAFGWILSGQFGSEDSSNANTETDSERTKVKPHEGPRGRDRGDFTTRKP